MSEMKSSTASDSGTKSNAPRERMTRRGLSFLQQAGVLASAMYMNKLDDLTWRKTERLAHPCLLWKNGKDIPVESERDNEEVMNAYSDLVKHV